MNSIKPSFEFEGIVHLIEESRNRAFTNDMFVTTLLSQIRLNKF